MKRMPWLLVIVLLAACYPPTPTPTPLPGSMVITDPFFMELVRVPAGEFLMGSDPVKDSGAEYRPDEQPQHRVTLPEFYIGRYEVTNDQYAAFVEATGHIAPDDRVLGYSFGQMDSGRKPVVGVSWHDATAFAEWLGEETGMGFRLCTEAEWEKACRGTNGSIYPWGDTPDFNKANVDCIACWQHTMRPVGTYSPAGDSPYGAADMAGNTEEWTSSSWGSESSPSEFPYPYDASDGRENQSAPDNVMRVMRGGSIIFGADDVRCAYRRRADPQFSEGDPAVDPTGIRVCVSPGR